MGNRRLPRRVNGAGKRSQVSVMNSSFKCNNMFAAELSPAPPGPAAKCRAGAVQHKYAPSALGGACAARADLERGQPALVAQECASTTWSVSTKLNTKVQGVRTCTSNKSLCAS